MSTKMADCIFQHACTTAGRKTQRSNAVHIDDPQANKRMSVRYLVEMHLLTAVRFI